MKSTRPVRGVVMVGGRSERMRATNGPLHKALVEIGGTSLLERNLRSLFASGVLDVVVVGSHAEPAVAAFVRERGTALARRYNAVLDIFIETVPLGNIGATREINDGRHDLLVVYADNITSLDLRGLLRCHRDADAAMTIATHVWQLRNPFGELDIDDGLVLAYREKPTRDVRISSGTCVISPDAAALVPPDRMFSAVQLFHAVHEDSGRVAAFLHDEPWVDVNDARAIQEAEAVIDSYPERFAV